MKKSKSKKYEEEFDEEQQPISRIYRIIASQPLTQAWTYEVEATSYEEAIEKIESGEADSNDDHEYYDHGDIEYEWDPS
jgi:hypothetical protein